MPIHDWTRVSAGTFHHFHTTWISELTKSLNQGLLPPDFYALAEQVAGQTNPDILALHVTEEFKANGPLLGAVTVTEAPPQVSITATADEADVYAGKRTVLAIRHSSNDELVAMIEIVSPGNKNRQRSLDQFLDKAVSALQTGCHLLLIDLIPPGPCDPDGIHGALWAEFSSRPYHAPQGKALTLAAYASDITPRAYVEPIAVGEQLPSMPLFLEPDWYVNVPLQATYDEAYAGVPARWRNVIEGAAT